MQRYLKFEPWKECGTIKLPDRQIGAAAQFSEFVQKVVAKQMKISIPIDFSGQELCGRRHERKLKQNAAKRCLTTSRLARVLARAVSAQGGFTGPLAAHRGEGASVDGLSQ